MRVSQMQGKLISLCFINCYHQLSTSVICK